MLIRDKVENLIKLGYDDDIIAMTLGLSEEQLEISKRDIQLRKEAEARKPKPKTKMQLLRERYNALYNTEKKEAKSEDKKTLDKEQREQVELIITTVERDMKELLDLPANEQVKAIRKIKNLLATIDAVLIPSDLAKRIYTALQTDKIFKIKDRNSIATLRRLVDRYKAKCLESYSNEIEEIDDIATLQGISKQLTDLYSSSYITYSSLVSKINRKIQDIKVKNYKEQVNISDEVIEGLVALVVDPSIDLEQLKEQIKQNGLAYYERKKRMVEETAINRGMARLQTPTEEGSLRQVYYQMTDYIKSNLHIKDADFLYQRLMSLGLSKTVVANAIVKNLMEKKRFYEAETFVEKTFGNEKDRIEADSRRRHLSDIKRAKIANFIMRGINAKEGEIEDEEVFFRMIERGIEQSRLDSITIVLGLAKDGKTKITWADVTAKEKVRKDFDISD